MVDFPPTPERSYLTDFATIFAHMWYRDFPLHSYFRNQAQRADWTTHIGIAVRSTADLMGLFTHFESGERTDAVLRNNHCHPVAALEWEWNALHRGDKAVTEFRKLQELCARPDFTGLHFACLIGYGRSGTGRADYSSRSAIALEGYTERWDDNLPPLLLVVIGFEWKGKQQGRRFTTMTLDKIERKRRTRLREQPAYPWDVVGSRWTPET